MNRKKKKKKKKKKRRRRRKRKRRRIGPDGFHDWVGKRNGEWERNSDDKEIERREEESKGKWMKWNWLSEEEGRKEWVRDR